MAVECGEMRLSDDRSKELILGTYGWQCNGKKKCCIQSRGAQRLWHKTNDTNDERILLGIN